MRNVSLAVAVLSAMLLVTVLAPRWARGPTPGRAKPEPLDIRLVSTGRGLDRPLVGPRRFLAAMFVGDEFMDLGRTRDALWVATITPDRRLDRVDAFDLSGTPSAMADFYDYCRACPANTALAMTVSRSICLPDRGPAADAAGLVATLFEELGASLAPCTQESVSWAFICLRRPHGWIALAEACSPNRGIVLNYCLRHPPETYDRYAAHVLHERPEPPRRLHLLDMLPDATGLPDAATVALSPFLTGVHVDALRAPAHVPAHAAWTYTLGKHAAFSCRIGLETAQRDLPPVRAQLRVNGRLVAHKTVPPTAGAPHWIPWHVDLHAFADRTVTLELTVTPIPETPAAFVMWGDPVLTGA
jgi:hypothetical protein